MKYSYALSLLAATAQAHWSDAKHDGAGNGQYAQFQGNVEVGNCGTVTSTIKMTVTLALSEIMGLVPSAMYGAMAPEATLSEAMADPVKGPMGSYAATTVVENYAAVTEVSAVENYAVENYATVTEAAVNVDNYAALPEVTTFAYHTTKAAGPDYHSAYNSSGSPYGNYTASPNAPSNVTAADNSTSSSGNDDQQTCDGPSTAGADCSNSLGCCGDFTCDFDSLTCVSDDDGSFNNDSSSNSTASGSCGPDQLGASCSDSTDCCGDFECDSTQGMCVIGGGSPSSSSSSMMADSTGTASSSSASSSATDASSEENDDGCDGPSTLGADCSATGGCCGGFACNAENVCVADD